MLGILRSLCSRDSYEICEERGHDWRDDVETFYKIEDGTSKLEHYQESGTVSDQIEVIETGWGDQYSYLKITQHTISVCRDCGEERENYEGSEIQARCNDGVHRPFSDLYENDEENNG